jgi:3-phosphoglycerate kinase
MLSTCASNSSSVIASSSAPVIARSPGSKIPSSRAIAEAIVEATKNGAFSLIGGGDSVACINKFDMSNDVSYVSTGGGALLEAIEGKELPGIAAIK